MHKVIINRDILKIYGNIKRNIKQLRFRKRITGHIRRKLSISMNEIHGTWNIKGKILY